MFHERLLRIVALTAIVPAGATLYFFVFWRWFDFWRKHRAATLSLMLGTLGGFGVAVYLFRASLSQPRVAFPFWLRCAGWALVAIATLLAFVADRQIGIRVRSFMPFFDAHGRIELQTRGAYGIVRHPIYASGIGYQLGAFFVTGYVSVAAACAVFALGAAWFTRQEERRLVALLDDPTEYDRYRARVPALLPFTKRRRR